MSELSKIHSGESIAIALTSTTDLSGWTIEARLYTSVTSPLVGTFPATDMDDFAIVANATNYAINISPNQSSKFDCGVLSMQLSLLSPEGARLVNNCTLAQIVGQYESTVTDGQTLLRTIDFSTLNVSVDVALANRVGIDGAKGDTGKQGPQGIQGLEGPRGEKGERGEQGVQGVKGDTGQAAPQLIIEYSADGATWHNSFLSDDAYMRTSVDGGIVWSAAMPFRQDVFDKAGTSGYYPELSVGQSDVAGDLLPFAGTHETSRWRFRSSGGSASLTNGASRLNALTGATVRQLAANGNFASWTSGKPTGWTKLGGESVADEAGALKITATVAAGGIKQVLATVSGHVYYVSARVKTTINNTSTFIVGNLSGSYLQLQANKGLLWSICSSLAQATGASSNLLLYDGRASDWTPLYFDKTFGVRVIDLTEMGLATTLTTAAACDAYFGDSYIPYGITSSEPAQLVTRTPNQYDRANDYLAGYGIVNGAVAAKTGANIAIIKCLKSETGSGKNNGYRLHTSASGNLVAVGFSYIKPTTTNGVSIQSAGTVSTTDTDYTTPDEGYIVAEVTNKDDLYVHLKWSYTDFSDIYRDFPVFVKNVRTLPFGILRGVFINGTYVADTIDLVNRKKTVRVGVHNDGSAWSDYYALATPVVSDIDGSILNTIQDYDFGTEELVGDNAVMPSSVTMEYSQTVRDKVRTLPNSEELISMLAAKASRKIGSSSPLNVVVPISICDFYVDSTNRKLYVSLGTAADSWMEIGLY